MHLLLLWQRLLVTQQRLVLYVGPLLDGINVQVAVEVQVVAEGAALARVRDVAQDGGERDRDEEEDRGEPGGGEEPQVVGCGGEGEGNGGGGEGRGRRNRALEKKRSFVLVELGDLARQQTFLGWCLAWQH